MTYQSHAVSESSVCPGPSSMDLSQKSINADSRSSHQPVRLSSYQWQVDDFLPKSDLESDFGIGLLCKLDCLLVHTCVGISLLKRTYSHSFPHCHKTLRKGFRPEQPSVWMLYRLNLGAILLFFSYISWGGPFCLPVWSPFSAHSNVVWNIYKI